MIIRNLHTLYLPFRKKVLDFLYDANDQIDCGLCIIEPFETARNKGRQHRLYLGGASQTDFSIHQLTCAIDIWPTLENGTWPTGKQLDEWPHWDLLAQIGCAHDLEAGHYFRKRVNGKLKPWPDSVHFQMQMGHVSIDMLKQVYYQKGIKSVWKYLDLHLTYGG